MSPCGGNWHMFKQSLINNKGISKAAATIHLCTVLSELSEQLLLKQAYEKEGRKEMRWECTE